ncbi:hypothetical protein HPB51_001681 [Rhipicephalus microplus]|uniref:Uncharacterized protein n=1 Tax=Rhipicephalus microplus TaxID=6941 RepID=A0A9J6EWA6_RHIMP|nr:hypothetical protein HPB51_001681 [Rhipicephalus microplus]
MKTTRRSQRLSTTASSSGTLPLPEARKESVVEISVTVSVVVSPPAPLPAPLPALLPAPLPVAVNISEPYTWTWRNLQDPRKVNSASSLRVPPRVRALTPPDTPESSATAGRLPFGHRVQKARPRRDMTRQKSTTRRESEEERQKGWCPSEGRRVGGEQEPTSVFHSSTIAALWSGAKRYLRLRQLH